MSELATQKQEIYDYAATILGDGMVDVDLDPKHYKLALDKALSRLRQRTDNSVQESYIFLTLIEDQNDYILPKEVVEVRKIFRRAVGARSGNGGGATTFEPFNLAYTNAYLLSSTSMGGLATYELFAGRQELVARMFGGYIDFSWNSSTKKISLYQRPRGEEIVMLHAYTFKPDSELIDNYLTNQWIKDYTVAVCKMMLGEARSKFSTIAGPQGGTALNGDALKAEAQVEMEKLEKDVSEQVAGGQGYGFLIG